MQFVHFAVYGIACVLFLLAVKEVKKITVNDFMMVSKKSQKMEHILI